jgi:hypothetical protein
LNNISKTLFHHRCKVILFTILTNNYKFIKENTVYMLVTYKKDNSSSLQIHRRT